MTGVAGAAFQQDILFAFGGGDPAITIAVLDGPVDRTHDCFRGARLAPLETVAQSHGTDGEATAQGTHIASLIFGQPCSSAEGVAPLCRGLTAPIFADDRHGCSQSELAHAIALALDQGAHVINISGGLFQRSRQLDPLLVETIGRCNGLNVLIITAAGEDGCGSLLRACGATCMLPVGAIDGKARLLSRARNRGLQHEGILAPGSGVIGAALEGGIAGRSGANASAALVSGIAGQLLGAQAGIGQSPDPRAVGEAILKTATPRIPSGPHDCPRMLTGWDNVHSAARRVAASAGGGPIAMSPLDRWRGSHGSPARQSAFRPRV